MTSDAPLLCSRCLKTFESGRGEFYFSRRSKPLPIPRRRRFQATNWPAIIGRLARDHRRPQGHSPQRSPRPGLSPRRYPSLQRLLSRLDREPGRIRPTAIDQTGASRTAIPLHRCFVTTTALNSHPRRGRIEQPMELTLSAPTASPSPRPRDQSTKRLASRFASSSIPWWARREAGSSLTCPVRRGSIPLAWEIW